MSEVQTFLNDQATALREVVSSLENFEVPEFDVDALSYDEKWDVVRDVVSYYPQDVLEELQNNGYGQTDLEDTLYSLRSILSEINALGSTDLEDVMGEVESIASSLESVIYEIESA